MSRYLAAVFDGSRVHEKNLLPQGHSTTVTSAVYSPDGKKILSASEDETIKEWDAATGKCLKTHKEYHVILGYPASDIIVTTEGNKIFVPDASGQGERELINIPGLFIQGCSFQNLEKGCQWSEEGLEILRQCHACVSVGQ